MIKSLNTTFQQIPTFFDSHVRQNPIAERDGLVASRQPILLVASAFIVVVALGAFALVALANLDGYRSQDRREWFGFVVGAYMLFQCLLSLASASGIAGEKERGTYELLQTTGLTPGQIVVGKYLASLRQYTLIFLVLSPAIIAPLAGGYVNLGWVLLAFVTLFFHGAAHIAIGVCASARSHKSRNAIVSALAASMFVTGPLFFFPSIFYLAEGSQRSLTPFITTWASVTLALSFAWGIYSLALARASLAPKREPKNQGTLSAATLSISVLALGLVASAWCSVDVLRDQDAMLHFLTFALGLSSLYIASFEVARHSTHRSSATAHSSLEVALKISLRFFIIGALAGALALPGLALNEKFDFSTALGFALGNVVFLPLFFTFAMLMTSVSARIFRTPLFRTLAAAFTGASLILGPFFASEFLRPFFGRRVHSDLAFLNPSSMSGSVAGWFGRHVEMFDFNSHNSFGTMTPVVSLCIYLLACATLILLLKFTKARR